MCDMCEDPWFERDRDFTLVVGDFRSPDKCDTWVVLLLLVGVQQLRSAFQFSMIASADEYGRDEFDCEMKCRQYILRKW